MPRTYFFCCAFSIHASGIKFLVSIAVKCIYYLLALIEIVVSDAVFALHAHRHRSLKKHKLLLETDQDEALELTNSKGTLVFDIAIICSVFRADIAESNRRVDSAYILAGSKCVRVITLRWNTVLRADKTVAMMSDH